MEWPICVANSTGEIRHTTVEVVLLSLEIKTRARAIQYGLMGPILSYSILHRAMAIFRFSTHFRIKNIHYQLYSSIKTTLALQVINWSSHIQYLGIFPLYTIYILYSSLFAI